MTATAPAALTHAAHSLNLSLTDLEPLREHAAAVYLLRREGLVARVTTGGADAEAAQRGVPAARWFAGHGVAVTEPADVEQPFVHDGIVVTFWTHYPQDRDHQPPAEILGTILRDLHAAPAPPFELPRYQPLVDLGRALTGSRTLSRDDRDWLLSERERLVAAYNRIDSALGTGHVHGDAYPGNLLWDGETARLGDWDEVAIAPRELDLANTYQGVRFGRPEADIAAFSDAYGFDPSNWSDLTTLIAMRELHTLASYIRKADRGSLPARDQLELRIDTLRRNDSETRWSAA